MDLPYAFPGIQFSRYPHTLVCLIFSSRSPPPFSLLVAPNIVLGFFGRIFTLYSIQRFLESRGYKNLSFPVRVASAFTWKHIIASAGPLVGGVLLSKLDVIL